MILTVFGATGGLGKRLVQVAIQQGHEVRAHARTPAKLGIDHPAVIPIRGDLANEDSLREAVIGADAVLSCIGFSKGEDPATYGAGIARIIEAMKSDGIHRFLSISGAGLELPDDHTPFGRRLIIGLLKVFARNVLAGKQHEWQAIRDSGIDWTLVRVARMVDRAPSGVVKVDLHQVSGSPIVAYGGVASWMLDEVNQRNFIQMAPFVSGC